MQDDKINLQNDNEINIVKKETPIILNNVKKSNPFLNKVMKKIKKDLNFVPIKLPDIIEKEWNEIHTTGYIMPKNPKNLKVDDVYIDENNNNKNLRTGSASKYNIKRIVKKIKFTKACVLDYNIKDLKIQYKLGKIKLNKLKLELMPL